MAQRPRLARTVHPVAWWGWAICISVGATRTTNPLILLALIAAVGAMTALRRTDAPWARGFRVYLTVAAIVILIRVLLRALLGGQGGATVLFRLPEIDLPERAAGIRLGGPVTLEGVLSALYDGLRIATPLVCVGAANTLADPKQLIKSLPAAVYEVGAAVTIAITTAPQFIESGQRVRRAQMLRGDVKRHRVRRVLIPVIENALDRSLTLAAAMDSRGYGRAGTTTPTARVVHACALLGGLGGVAIGVYGVLDATTPPLLGAPMLIAGATLAVIGLWLSGRDVERTRYRPHRWGLAEFGVIASGALSAAAMIVGRRRNAGAFVTSVRPPEWPSLPPAALLAVGFVLAAVAAAPPPPVGERQ